MAYFNWNDSYSVKIREIDAQHMELINILNELYEAMSVSKGNEIMGGIITRLIKYTRQHFTTEEKYMEKFGYPDYYDHKKEHDEFTSKVMAFDSDFRSGKVALSLSITSFLKTWLVKHISGVDKKYTAFFNSKGLL